MTKKYGIILQRGQLHGSPYGAIKMNDNSRVIERRRLKIVKLKTLFGGKCVQCGYDVNFSCLDFHHLDKKTKRFPLTATSVDSRPIEESIEEAKKCLLLCRNCHTDLHHPQNRKSEFIHIDLDSPFLTTRKQDDETDNKLYITEVERVCTQCSLTKKLSEFNKNAKGYKNYCKSCEYEKSSKCVECGKVKQRYRYDTDDKYFRKYLPLCEYCEQLIAYNEFLLSSKECRRCGETKPVVDFPINNQRTDGRHYYCKECVKKHKAK